MKNRLIHVGRFHSKGGGVQYVYLREKGSFKYVWYEVNQNGQEQETEVAASHIEEAIRLAHNEWNHMGFRTVICGFRYTLPERDEHGINALFYQMVASYASFNGVYYEEELGYNCIVHHASEEALSLWRKLKEHRE